MVVLGELGSMYGVGLTALIVATTEVFTVLILPSYLTTAVELVDALPKELGT